MADCVSISNGLLGACNYKVSGLDQIYIGNAASFTFSRDANSVVTGITATSGATFFEFEAEVNTAGANSALQIGTGGNRYFQQQVQFQNSNDTYQNLEVLKDLGLSKVVAIVKSKTGQYELYGVPTPLRAITLEFNSGVAEGDASGYNVVLQAVTTELRSLIADGVTIPT